MDNTQDTRIGQINVWDDLNIKDELLRGIYAYGFETPSVIQKQSIDPMIHKHDIIAHAQSGTGKTGAFTVGALQQVDTTLDTTQILILAPTHELVNQIAGVVKSLGNFIDGLRIQTLIGGTSVRQDIELLQKSPPHIVVGTAGRITDMINRRYLNISTVDLLVIDEADEMLSSEFKEKVYHIFQFLQTTTQIAIFSATLPVEVLELTNKFMKNPVSITIKNEELSLDGITQVYIALNENNDKYNVLKDIFEKITVSQCIIYMNNINTITDLFNAMISDGFSVCCIHSSMNRNERESTIQSFKSGKFRMLLSSNLTARGIDVQQVGTVINFDIPTCVHTYLHRIGRSGRWGRKGLAINFVTKRDIYNMRKIENHYSIKISELTNDLLG
jgi:translation initiation factor 4A